MNGAIAIITARGGSKRIPKKNIKEFCGKPIIAYSIEAAFASKIFTEVMVSTDDPEIADIAIQYGAKVPFLRSNETSDDFSTTRDVLDEVIATYKTKLKRRFVSAKKLREAYDMLKDCKTDQVIPVVQFSFPPQRGFIIDSAGALRYKWPENQRKRSQDLEPFYHDAGQFYFFDAEVFYKQKQTTELSIKPYILSDLEVQDIDNIEDWQIAEIKYQLAQQR